MYNESNSDSVVNHIMTEKREMRIYEVLGVKQFQQLVFLLEKIIHRKDKGKNINYHIPNNDISALDAFIKFLFYNGAIHTRNLVIFVVYLSLKFLFSFQIRFYDYILIALAVKDLYCIMLQRYNLLRIQRCKSLMAMRQARKKEAILSEQKKQFHDNYDYSYATVDLDVIKRIKACVSNQETIILSDSDIATLNRLLSASHSHIEK